MYLTLLTALIFVFLALVANFLNLNNISRILFLAAVISVFVGPILFIMFRTLFKKVAFNTDIEKLKIFITDLFDYYHRLSARSKQAFLENLTNYKDNFLELYHKSQSKKLIVHKLDHRDIFVLKKLYIYIIQEQTNNIMAWFAQLSDDIKHSLLDKVRLHSRKKIKKAFTQQDLSEYTERDFYYTVPLLAECQAFITQEDPEIVGASYRFKENWKVDFINSINFTSEAVEFANNNVIADGDFRTKGELEQDL